MLNIFSKLKRNIFIPIYSNGSNANEIIILLLSSSLLLASLYILKCVLHFNEAISSDWNLPLQIGGIGSLSIAFSVQGSLFNDPVAATRTTVLLFGIYFCIWAGNGSIRRSCEHVPASVLKGRSKGPSSSQKPHLCHPTSCLLRVIYCLASASDILQWSQCAEQSRC